MTQLRRVSGALAVRHPAGATPAENRVVDCHEEAVDAELRANRGHQLRHERARRGAGSGLLSQSSSSDAGKYPASTSAWRASPTVRWA